MPSSSKPASTACTLSFCGSAVAGQGVTLTFEDADQRRMGVGIQQDIEGSVVGAEWKPGRWLNDDDTVEGRQVHLPSDRFSIQRVTLFKYD